jgi:hypothetical protein
MQKIVNFSTNTGKILHCGIFPANHALKANTIGVRMVSQQKSVIKSLNAVIPSVVISVSPLVRGAVIDAKRTIGKQKMMIELSTPLPLLTPKGKAFCHFLIDYGFEHHLMWVCFQDDTGECWTWPNHQIRVQSNPTGERYTTNDHTKIASGPKREPAVGTGAGPDIQEQKVQGLARRVRVAYKTTNTRPD